jgi:integrase
LRFKKPDVALLSRDYHELRSNDEIRRLLAATAREDEPVAVFYAHGLHGRMRAGKLAALEWHDVDSNGA